MDFGLREIGLTFMVGAFTILGFELIIFQYFSSHLTGFYEGKLGFRNSPDEQKREESFQNLTIAIFIGLAFGIGVIAENLSYKYVDSVEDNSIRLMPNFVRDFLPYEIQNYSSSKATRGSRIGVLINNLDEKPLIDSDKQIGPDFLGIDLANQGAFKYADENNGEKIQNWILQENRCNPHSVGCFVTYDEIANSVDRLYYIAKNNVYLKDNYYDEMKKIEARRDFSRSIALISYLYFILSIWYIPFLLIYKFKNDRSKNKAQKSNAKNTNNKSNLSGYFHILKKTPYTIGVFLLIWFFSIWAFERELDEFHKRSFGYYSSILLEEKKVKRNQVEIENEKKNLPK